MFPKTNNSNIVKIRNFLSDSKKIIENPIITCQNIKNII